MFKIGKVLTFLFCIGICQLILSANLVYAKKVKVNTPEQEYKYQQKVLRQQEVEKYDRSLLPPSGYMTNVEYEKLSNDVPNSEVQIPEPKLPKDIKMKYVPQPVYELTLYNNPPGSPELKIPREFKFDRQVSESPIISPNKEIMVYPVLYYYASKQCTSGDLFVISLDKTLPDVERVMRANVVNRNPTPILSTEKNINEQYTFRTMTPIDFSKDGTKILAKEKIGYVYDGIWKTNAWVYDFHNQSARNLVEVRDAIRYYWLNSQQVVLDEKRWDIFPLGFDANDSNRIIVSAYGYTGKSPKFLGTWSIDCNGERTLLVSLTSDQANVSVSGLKIKQTGIVNPTVVFAEEKKQDKLVKKKRKKEKKAQKLDKKKKKQALNTKLKKMKKDEREGLKQFK